MSDLISRQAAIDALCEEFCRGHDDCSFFPNCDNLESVRSIPSAQSEYYDYSDIDDVWEYYAEEQDIKLKAIKRCYVGWISERKTGRAARGNMRHLQTRIFRR